MSSSQDFSKILKALESSMCSVHPRSQTEHSALTFVVLLKRETAVAELQEGAGI